MDFRIALPPLPEQKAIADYLDEKCAAIDALVAEKEALIADLEAYKKSLIFEVVTGKREVA
jgi:type I restriction enzyme S subunit